MFFNERPRDLSYRSRSGIFYTILGGEFRSQFQNTIGHLLRWSDSYSVMNSRSVDGFRLLDTFLSDTLNEESLSQIFRHAISQKIPVKLLLVNLNSSFAIARHNSLSNNTSHSSKNIENRAINGLKRLIMGLYYALEISDDDTEFGTLRYDGLVLKFQQILEEQKIQIELRFYTVVPSGPMFFFQDILLSGFYCASLSSRDLPWLVIIDDPNIRNDMYDVFSEEFQRIWNMSSQEREENSPSFYAHSYFISYAREDTEAADHLESLLWRKTRLANRDEARLTAGVNLSDDLESVIAKSQTFLFLCSQSSNNSDWCRGEVQIAFEKCIQRIIVISLDGSRPQDLRL